MNRKNSEEVEAWVKERKKIQREQELQAKKKIEDAMKGTKKQKKMEHRKGFGKRYF